MTGFKTGLTDSHPVDTGIQYFETRGGGKVYRIPVQEFPGLSGFTYLVLADEYRVLIDTGSGFGAANDQIVEGLAQASRLSGVDVSLPNLTHILITHGHIDHFGGLTYIRPLTQAKIGIHELDKRIVTNHEERLFVVARHLGDFLAEAGISLETRNHLLDMYKLTKSLFRSVAIDFTYNAYKMSLGPFQFLHVPGHCAGHVVIRLHDVLFSGDHVLAETSPHQAPEQLTLSTGLDHYLKSLERVRPWAKEVRVTLAGHEDPIVDLEARLDAILLLHRERLQTVLDILREPHTISEVSHTLFGDVSGYNVLLALEEAGAHVEYLYQRGLLGITNLSEIESASEIVPIRYQCTDCDLEIT